MGLRKDSLFKVNHINVVLLVLVLISSQAHAFFGPKDYDECILENMKGTTSNAAAIAIKKACLKKFPKKKKREYDYSHIFPTILPESDASKVEAKASLRDNTFIVRLFNGSRYNLTSITVRVHDEGGGTHRDYDAKVSHGEYGSYDLTHVGEGLSSNKIGHSHFQLFDAPSDLRWSVLSIKGTVRN